ncbi:hypothetical protein ACFZBU_39935 [Embleya sp. NPDC008237]|uniref:hypothetical protein n=1 Tax=Embleya sp. NPDC008237 TaxID=3363978 RepID=UPI0036E9F767
MALTSLAIHDLTESVLGCVCAANPCTGEPDVGQLSVSVARIYASSSDDFPLETRVVQGMRGCVPPPITAVELVVAVLRCAPSFDESGCPPTCEELATTARRLHVDMVTVYNALLCCLPSTDATRRRGRMFVLGPQRTVGPEGGCAGLEQRMTVGLPGCGCPEEAVVVS